jgi:large subunit ribosomal protein L24
MTIKTGDTVRVLAGKDRGKTGKVLQTFARENRVVVDGVNMRVKHVRGAKGQPGKKVEYAAPLHRSNVALLAGKVAGRVGSVTRKDGVKVRIVRKAAATHELV